MKTIITFLFISVILALGRIIPHPPNFTPILATAIYTPYMVKDKWIAMLIPLSAMFIADIIIGFHPYMLWIYGAIGISTLLSYWSMRFNKKLTTGLEKFLKKPSNAWPIQNSECSTAYFTKGKSAC